MFKPTSGRVAVVAALVVAGCGGPEIQAPVVPELVVAEWPLPTPTGSANPDLVAAPDGSLLLSWIERLDAGEHRLALARFDAGAWSAPMEAGRGARWFVNWADTPHVLALPDGSLWAHWMERSGEGTYDYGIRLVRSTDAGRSWEPLPSVHPTGLPLDFGFVSLWPSASDTLGIAWLDSRHKTTGGHGGHHGHGEGAMALYATTVDASGRVAPADALDLSTCDCCTTSVAQAAGGTVLAYRSRTDEEVRDIDLVRYADGQWQAPVRVHDDGWVIPGCPVNGPVVSAHGARVWVGWYTEAGGVPRIRIAGSDDGGTRFAAPVEWRAGPHLLGRLAMAADEQALWWAWMEEHGSEQSLWLARAPHDLAPDTIATVQVASFPARGRASGFPRIALDNGAAHLVWTEVADGRPRLAGARVGPAGPGSGIALAGD